jgi:hypothetical protein
MEPPARFANAFDQSSLNIHMNVFQFWIELDGAGQYLTLDLFETLQDGREIRIGQKSLGIEHASVRLGPSNIVLKKTNVESHGGIEGASELAHALVEAAASRSPS